MLARWIVPLVAFAIALSALPGLAADPPNAAAVAELEQKAAELERQMAVLQRDLRDLRRQIELAKRGVSTQPDATIAWGKAANGLQVGLAFQHAEKRVYRVGETARFVVKLRNPGGQNVVLRFDAGAIETRLGPSVLDASGERPPMSGPVRSGVGGRAINQLVVAAGQEIEFATAELVLGPPGELRVEPKMTLHAKPGKYRVSYHVHYLNADDTGNFMTTGEVEMEVRDATP